MGVAKLSDKSLIQIENNSDPWIEAERTPASTLTHEEYWPFNPVKDGGQKMPPTNFSLVTSTIVEISPQKFLTLSFTPFCHTCVKPQGHT